MNTDELFDLIHARQPLEFEVALGYQVQLRSGAEAFPLDARQPSRPLALEKCERSRRSVLVDVDASDTERAESGVYNGSLTLVVRPI